MKSLLLIFVLAVATVTSGTLWMNSEINKRVELEKPGGSSITAVTTNGTQRICYRYI